MKKVRERFRLSGSILKEQILNLFFSLTKKDLHAARNIVFGAAPLPRDQAYHARLSLRGRCTQCAWRHAAARLRAAARRGGRGAVHDVRRGGILPQRCRRVRAVQRWSLQHSCERRPHKCVVLRDVRWPVHGRLLLRRGVVERDGCALRHWQVLRRGHGGADELPSRLLRRVSNQHSRSV